MAVNNNYYNNLARCDHGLNKHTFNFVGIYISESLKQEEAVYLTG